MVETFNSSQRFIELRGFHECSTIPDMQRLTVKKNGSKIFKATSHRECEIWKINMLKIFSSGSLAEPTEDWLTFWTRCEPQWDKRRACSSVG